MCPICSLNLLYEIFLWLRLLYPQGAPYLTKQAFFSLTVLLCPPFWPTVLEWVWWKMERRHVEPGVITYRRLYCKEHYRRVQKGSRDRHNKPSLPLIGGEKR
jgi:hypothetical protein